MQRTENSYPFFILMYSVKSTVRCVNVTHTVTSNIWKITRNRKNVAFVFTSFFQMHHHIKDIYAGNCIFIIFVLYFTSSL